jgi:sporulation protein YlmC with PRC-barrel domain
MQLNQGASVFLARGKQVGHIDRVVIDPKTNEISHIIIRQGFLFTQDKVMPVGYIATSEGGRITLNVSDTELADLPDFEEKHYVVSSGGSGGAMSGPIGVAPPSLYSYPPQVGTNYTKQVRQNIPEDTVAVKEGAKVTTRDGREMGHVEQVLTRAYEDYVTHIVVSIPTGLLAKEKKMIPVGWIDRLEQNEVHLAVDAITVEKLPTIEYA